MPFMVIDSAIGMLITASVALLFASAGVHKLRGLRRFDETSAAYGLMPALAHLRISRMVPILEIALAVGLLADGSRGCARTVGEPASLFHRWSHDSVRFVDHCARLLERRPLAGTCPAQRAVARFAMTPVGVSVVVLWIVVLCLLAVVLALTRQLGVLHERIAPVGALMLNRGLAVGEPAPAIDVVDLHGANLRLGAPRTDGKSTLLLFVSPTCPVCKSLLPIVKSSGRDERDWLDIILASDGNTDEHRDYIRANGLGGIPYVLSAPLGMTFQVSRLPFAALLDEAGILRARGLINSREHLESLFEAKRLGVASLQDYFANAK